MKLIKVFLILISCLPVSGMAQYSVMTYNLRLNIPSDGENRWDNRKEWVSDLVNYYAPDVLGIQEGLPEQVQYLDSALIGYDYVGVGRDDGRNKGEFSAIFYQTKKLKVQESGTFWLSETPEKPSFGWGANYRRICTWARMKDLATGREFMVFNTHFDHESKLARLNSAKLILQSIEELNTTHLPVIVMGDFNTTPETPPIQLMRSKLKDSRNASKTKPFGPIGTFNGFDTTSPLNTRIDYVFVNESITVEKYAVLAESRYQRTPSDHLPVFVHVSF